MNNSVAKYIISRPVTTEGQKFEILEDPSKSLPERSPMDPIWLIFFFNFPEFRDILAAILANIGLRNSQADLGLDAAQFRVLHTLRLTNSMTAS